ncbi:MAG: hypothetical protein ACFFBP_03475 [Promethearchaeota archaeon]
MEGRSEKILIIRLAFFIGISVILLVGFIWADSIQVFALPHIPVFLVFFAITWIAIISLVIFEKLIQI